MEFTTWSLSDKCDTEWYASGSEVAVEHDGNWDGEVQECSEWYNIIIQHCALYFFSSFTLSLIIIGL